MARSKAIESFRENALNIVIKSNWVVSLLFIALAPYYREQQDYFIVMSGLTFMSGQISQWFYNHNHITSASVAWFSSATLIINSLMLIPGGLLMVPYTGVIIVLLAGLIFRAEATFIMAFICVITNIMTIDLFIGWKGTSQHLWGPIILMFTMATIMSFNINYLEGALGWVDSQSRKRGQRRDELLESQQALQQAHKDLSGANRALAQAQAELAHLNGELELRVLERTAELAASEERYRHLFEQTQATLIKTEALYQVTRLLNVSSTLPEVLQTIVDSVARALPANAVSLIIMDFQREQVIHFVKGGGGGQHVEVVTYHELQEGLSGWVLQHGQPALSPKNQRDERESDVVYARRLASNDGSIIVVPISQYETILGTMTAINLLTQPDFTPQDVELMQSMAAQAAVAIENNRMFHALQEHAAQLEVQNQRLAHLIAAYGRFVPHEFLHLLARQSITEVELGDQVQQTMSVLFCDIRGFTTLSENMTPKENFNFVNGILGCLSPIVRQHHGLIDKYIGDAIMALFPRQADDAIQAGVAMLKALAQYNAQRPDQPQVRIGIGVHTGSLMLGTIGESQRMETTVISDVVNTAARLEGLTKRYGAGLLVSKATLDLLTQPCQSRFLDKVNVKGKRQFIEVYEIFDGDDEALIGLKQAIKPLFERGVQAYYQQEFAETVEAMQTVLAQLPGDKMAQLYLEEAQAFVYAPPMSDWTGVTQMDM